MQHHTFPGSELPAAYGAYSHAIEAGDYVFLAGQTARDGVTGKLIEGDVGAQTARALELVQAILGKLGLGLKDVVRSTVYLADIEDFDAMNRVYGAVFQAPYPARSTPEARLPFGARVSIEVTAYRGAGTR
jgi:2-iminobutanoate/2-iminopropanoate deaminase